MPSTRRKAIDYTPPFGGAIVRPKEVVEEEQAALEQDTDLVPEDTPAGSPREEVILLQPEIEEEPVPSPAIAKRGKKLASNDISMLASISDYPAAEVIAAIRKVVKTPGREVSFVRLSAEEKGQLADIVYTYKRQGQKTSENEINRIAINFLLRDYQANGERSVLALTLADLLA